MFFLFEMGFEGLFMWGLGCTKVEFLMIQFPKHLGNFFCTTKMSGGGHGGLEKKT